LPIATTGANALAAFTANLIRFTQQHPQMTKLIAGFIAVTAAVALVVGPILMLAGLIGAASVGFEVLGGVVGAIAAVGFAPLLIAVLAIGAAITGVVLIVMNWKTILHEVGAGLHNLAVMFGLIKAPAVATRPLGGAPPAKDVQALVLRHKHYEMARKNEWYYQDTRTNKWIPDGKYTPGKGTGGGGALHTGPITIGPIHVHAAAGMDEERLAASTARRIGDELVHHLTSGAPSILGLSPVLNTPVAR